MQSRRTLVRTAAAAAALIPALSRLRPARADDSTMIDTSNYAEMANGVRYTDVKRGTGPEPQQGQTINVAYTGWLFDDGKRGKKFDSSDDHGGSLSFALGTGQVIPGWDAGVSTMHVGGERILIIPPGLAYGDKGVADAIPPNATLMFNVKLLSIGK